ncbi:MAG: ribonuclease HII [Patescibacteria group bacterium]
MKRETKANKKTETKYFREGYRYIAGVDEAGRGAWAGPIVAAAVIMPIKYNLKLSDSKLLSPAAREDLFVPITRLALAWSVSIIEHDEIDRIGIQQANHQVIQRSVEKLTIRPEVILIDALKVAFSKTPTESIIRGDQKVSTIAAASIIAKVIRDHLMIGHHRLLPYWNFQRHKGYGTDEHHQLIFNHGLSPIHRRSYRPMNGM